MQRCGGVQCKISQVVHNGSGFLSTGDIPRLPSVRESWCHGHVDWDYQSLGSNPAFKVAVQ